jgi:hypothetical protein
MSDEVFQFPDTERRRGFLRYKLRAKRPGTLEHAVKHDLPLPTLPAARLNKDQFGQVIQVDFKNKKKK